eukprot:GEZU01038818.1.p1 GENE.GEZU01038818.1~~GEZU01038818.1.p1  ORF type:complete len:184 (+),score=66.86 GEZU01038818.1:175-726(+)
MGQGPVSKEKMKKYREWSKERLNTKEIENLHKLFHEVAPKGEMDIEGFKLYAKKAFPNAPPNSNFDHLFRGMDRNGDGTITFSEYLQYHAVYHSADIPELVEIVFSMYDQDGDGYVSKEEMIECITNCTRLKGVDVDTDENRALISGRVQKLLEIADENKDGFLTKDEILAAVKRDPGVLNIL